MKTSILSLPTYLLQPTTIFASALKICKYFVKLLSSDYDYEKW